MGRLQLVFLFLCAVMTKWSKRSPHTIFEGFCCENSKQVQAFVKDKARKRLKKRTLLPVNEHFSVSLQRSI